MKVSTVILFIAGLLATPVAAEDNAATALRSMVPSVTIKTKATDLVKPDFVDFTLAVVTEKPTPIAAAAANSEAIRGLLATLKELGIDANDISTASFQVTQVIAEERSSGGQTVKRVPRGYAASNTLSIRLRDMQHIGALAGAMIEKGVNKFESIEFGIKDRPQREEELRIKAMKQAALRAQTYAEALGVRLGRVLEINPETIEDEQSTGRYAFRRRSFVKVDNEARDPLVIPLEPEPVTLSADATIVWEIIK